VNFKRYALIALNKKFGEYKLIFKVGDLIDSRFSVKGLCSNSGGMGQVLYVEDAKVEFSGTLALKYCREGDDEYVKRFKREVRLLERFNGNSKVAKTLFSNSDNDPPYFVMKYYPDGDLINIIDDIVSDVAKQEVVFNKMIDCIAELHTVEVYHRDIKPQNFLLENDEIVVSDFGLGMEPESSSRFTSSSMFWGTQGYLPPEFQDGGFKHADETGDIFMLGKSFYVLLTKQNPTYLMDNRVHPALYYVIDRACALDKRKRYQSLSELKQALQLAFDVILNRGGKIGEVNQLITTIEDRLENESKYSATKVIEFIEKLALVDQQDQRRICQDLSRSFFSILPQERLIPYIETFLKVYRDFVESESYSWAFAENIATKMKEIFSAIDVDSKIRASALEMAIIAAYRMNRFAAMDTCSSMICSVTDEGLGVHVAAIMQRNDHSFITGIEPSQCKCDAIINYLRAGKQA